MYLADKAKSIKTQAKINNTETNKIIQDLIAEKEKLLRELDIANKSNKELDPEGNVVIK